MWCDVVVFCCVCIKRNWFGDVVVGWFFYWVVCFGVYGVIVGEFRFVNDWVVICWCSCVLWVFGCCFWVLFCICRFCCFLGWECCCCFSGCCFFLLFWWLLCFWWVDFCVCLCMWCSGDWVYCLCWGFWWFYLLVSCCYFWWFVWVFLVDGCCCWLFVICWWGYWFVWMWGLCMWVGCW